jgi:hypothetical protein
MISRRSPRRTLYRSTIATDRTASAGTRARQPFRPPWPLQQASIGELARRYGVALGREVLAAGKNAIPAPAMDIARVPHGGRGGENLGEDPLLAGEIGGAIGGGIQSEGVLAVAKHYVANNFEWLRTGGGSFARRSPAIDIRVSMGTLYEIYLEPFRRALVRYGVAGLLGSYNRLNGRYTCQDAGLLDLPCTQWGWAGFTVPDFLFAVRDPGAALKAGLDLPAQLKAFQVVRIEPGQLSQVDIEIPIDDLAIYDDDSRSRVVPGMYEIQLGVSSVDLRLKADVQVP